MQSKQVRFPLSGERWHILAPGKSASPAQCREQRFSTDRETSKIIVIDNHLIHHTVKCVYGLWVTVYEIHSVMQDKKGIQCLINCYF